MTATRRIGTGMVPVSCNLSAEQRAWLALTSDQLGISSVELIRRCIGNQMVRAALRAGRPIQSAEDET